MGPTSFLTAIYDIEPYGGPLGVQTQVTVTGEGFSRNGKAKCRFGIPGNYAIVEGKVLSSQRMICMSPKNFDVPKVIAQPFAVPFSVSFMDDKVNPWTGSKMVQKSANAGNASAESKFNPWTQTGHVFRFYTQPIIIRINPKSAKVRQIIDVYAYANPRTPFIERIIPLQTLTLL